MSTAPRRLFEEASAQTPATPTAPSIALVRTEDALRPLSAPAPAAAAPSPALAARGWLWLRDNAPGFLMGACSLLGVVLFWHLATTRHWDFYIRFTNIPTPMEVLDKVAQVNHNGKFITNIGMSLRRIVIGFAIATVVGVALGLVIGRYRIARGLLFPALEALRPIPAIAWVPMSIMLWPNNEASIVFITFIGAFFPILLNTIHGVHSLDGVLIRAARCLGASEIRLFMNVILPGSLPHIFTGLAVGMGVAWVSLIAAEMISGQFGIGYFTWDAYSLISYAEIVLGMITIGLLGLVCSGLIRMAGKALMPWLSFSTRGGAAR